MYFQIVKKACRLPFICAFLNFYLPFERKGCIIPELETEL
jgi:hypothetical protein